jgi:hypothetical protein
MSGRRQVLVDLEWTGRAPPSQGKFMAVGRFDTLRERWPAEAWSVVLHAPPGGFQAIGTAQASMLADDAPSSLLDPGSGFDVMEGPRRVARAVVRGEPDDSA